MTLRMNIFLVFVGISFILVAGCLSPGRSPDTSPSTLPTPQNTPVPTAASITPTQPGTPVTPFTKTEVRELFIDIAFGCDKTWVNKFTPSSENHLFFSLEGEVKDGDKEFVKDVVKEFNLLTPVQAFSEDPFSTRGSPIIFYPRKSLDSLDKDFIVCQELDPASGEPLYVVYQPVTEGPNGEQEVTTRIYLNAALQGAERNHYLQKAMLYYLGFPGETYAYPDSAFYYDNRTNVNFTPLDIEAMKTIYQPGIYQGMSVQEAQSLLLPSQ
jgi:hypothetical protein